MREIVFDIETDGLLDELSTIHCIGIHDVHSGKSALYTDNPGYPKLKDGLNILSSADLLIGHNLLSFDLPAIQKLYPLWETTAKIRDTLICTRLIWPDISDADYARIKAKKPFPARLIGRHSLEAWGYRINELKGDFCKSTNWQHWCKEMGEYCLQDVAVTTALWAQIKKQKYPEEAIELEHDFRTIIAKQEQNGFPFDRDRAVTLYSELSARREQLSCELRQLYPPKIIEETFIPKRNNKTKGWTAGVPVIKTKEIPFNPASRQQIAERLIAAGWKPENYTETGHPVVDENTLTGLHTPEAKALCDYLMIQKRIGQIAEGANAWLKLERDGKIHGEVITNGAVTGRCTHNRPNMAQIPAVGSPYGEECRSLFGPPPGWLQIGCDASGLELRCLAHYMAAYDGGAYARVILHGDIHTENQKAAGLETRAQAKRFIYALLYGAGDVKLGSILCPEGSEAQQKKAGAAIKAKFFRKIPAAKNLTDAVQAAADRGWLKGMDGRRLKVRSKHSALNLLLQSAGAVVMKKATIILWQDLEAQGLFWPHDYWQLAHVHDEYQLAARPELAELIGKTGVQAIRKAGDYFGFRCPLDGEYKIGRNWAETH